MNVELLGRSLYDRYVFDPLRPPTRGTAAIVRRAYGDGAIYWLPNAAKEADVAVMGGRMRIVLRAGIGPRRANYFAAQMLAKLQLLELHDWYRALALEPQLTLARELGAWIVAPTPAVQELRRSVGDDAAEIADAFCITQTCALLRISESGGPDSAIVTPHVVYRRGRRFQPFNDNDIRAIGLRRSLPKSVRRVTLTDEGKRVGLIAR